MSASETTEQDFSSGLRGPQDGQPFENVFSGFDAGGLLDDFDPPSAAALNSGRGLCPTRGSKGWPQPTFWCQCSEAVVSWSGSVKAWQNFQQGLCLRERGSNAVPNRVVEITHASTNALVRARVWRRHDELLGAVVLEKAGLLRHHKLLRARTRHVVHDKRRWGPPRKTGGGLPEQHNLLC